MPRPRLGLPRWITLVAATVAVGCASEEVPVRPSPVDPQLMAQSRKELSTSLQETRNTAIKWKDQSTLMITALERVVDPKQSDLHASYDSFSKAFAAFESETASMKGVSGKFHADGQKFLSNWEQDLASYANGDVRSEGESRRKEVHETFTEVQTDLDKALASLAELHVLAGDVKKYLDNALSTEGVEKISGAADDARKSAGKAAEEIDAATAAIDRMVKELPK